MKRTRSFPRHGWVGLGLIAIAWPLNWGLGVEGLRTHLLFFPLWLGYALAVDALVARRRGTSILTRSWVDFVGLFGASVPAWWFFEAINVRTQNWTYVGAEHFGDLTYALLATVAFSTVMPAVFGTAEWIRSFDWIDRLEKGPSLSPTRRLMGVFVGIGAAMLVLLLVWPTYFYPFTWGCAFFLTVPVNWLLGRPTLLDYTATGDWRPVVALALGALACGFVWEMWNAYAYPKWTYDAPGVNFWHVFEMPLIGFIGYLPFGLELHALAHLVFPRPPRLRL
ncbi:MAG: hypothetical protein ABEL04_11075 [Salinibacter sp.]|uniref:hypothetical protein n=1 Tax=Salinibacter sp. TaxID=2065818 RepID=UPI0035D4662C